MRRMKSLKEMKNVPVEVFIPICALTFVAALVVSLLSYQKYQNWESVHDASYHLTNCHTEYSNQNKHSGKKTVCDATITYTFRGKQYTEIRPRYNGMQPAWRLVNPNFPDRSEEVLTETILGSSMGLICIVCLVFVIYKKRRESELYESKHEC